MAKLDPGTLVQMGREYPDIAPMGIYERLKDVATMAKRHESLCVRLCNESLTEELDRKLIRLENRIGQALAQSFEGTEVIIGRDPRGATVKLLPPSGATNDWGREGLCVLE